MDKRNDKYSGSKVHESGCQNEGKQIHDIAKRRRSRRKDLVDDLRPERSATADENKNLRLSRKLRENKENGRCNPSHRYGMIVEDIIVDMEDVIQDIQQGKLPLESLPQLGLFPLHEAVARGLVKSARKLIELGLQLTLETPEGLTPLEIAVMAGNFDAAALLIQYGAPIDRIRDGIPQIVK